MDDNRADVFYDGVTTVPEGNNGASGGAMVSCGRYLKIHLTKAQIISSGPKTVDKYCPGDNSSILSQSSVLKFAPDLSEKQLIPLLYCIDGAE